MIFICIGDSYKSDSTIRIFTYRNYLHMVLLFFFSFFAIMNNLCLKQKSKWYLLYYYVKLVKSF